jgi:LSD1 subclass zinc finger protein
MMDALDGNAIAGLLFDVFGAEMTTATGSCASCGASGKVAEFEVYLRAPGTVARCHSCRNVLMVLVSVRGITCVDLRGLATLEPATNGPEAS